MAGFVQTPTPDCPPEVLDAEVEPFAFSPLPQAQAIPPPVPAVHGRELFAVTALVALADVTLYRGEGFAGLALWMLLAPALLVLGSPRLRVQGSTMLIGIMLVLLSARLAWLGSPLAAGIGFLLLGALSLALVGRVPDALDTAVCGVQALFTGGRGLALYAKRIAGGIPGVPRVPWLNVVLPLAALLLFGALFILANPDLAKSFAELADRFFRWQRDWFSRLAENWTEAGFWLLVAWIVAGLLRPVLGRPLLESVFPTAAPTGKPPLPAESPLYGALGNTLVAVTLLFAGYLVFEFKTLWFREFPKGFYYAGYAHAGAAWLTVALALATLVLSLIFRGAVLSDPRLGRLKGLAWLWSLENFLLAVAVYHRMSIYIDFNGMTRMRTIGLFGITAVFVGFGLVLCKIVQNRDFVWLVRRQLWTLAVAVYLFALTPVDTLVHAYNVRRILAGDLAPSVQISVHPISSEGVLMLPPLVDSGDPIIREGVRAMLAERAIQAERTAQEREHLGWTTMQFADRRLLDQLLAQRYAWSAYRDDARRAAALERFHKYAYQWY